MLFPSHLCYRSLKQHQATLVAFAHLVVEIANVIQHLVPDLHDVPGVVAFLVTQIAAGDLVVVSVVVDELGHGER